MIVYGYQEITVSTTVKTLTKPNGKEPGAAIICVSAQPVRFTRDGFTPPQATVGLRAIAGQTIHLIGTSQIENFQAIREGGSDATLSVEYVDSLGAIPAVMT